MPTVKDVIALRGPPGIRCFIAKCASGVFPSSCATGVGHKDDSEPEVRSTKGARRKAIPFGIVPEGGRIGVDISKSKRNVPWDVFQQRPFGSKMRLKGSGEVRPESGASSSGSLSRAGEAKGVGKDSHHR